MRRISSPDLAARSSPMKVMRPVTSKFLSRSLSTALQDIDLPEPDSPRMPRQRPGSTEKLTFLTI